MRLVHLSDLHFGHHDEQLAAGLADELSAQHPDLVVVSGDFAQVGTGSEFAAARAFLDTITAPVFAIPGNHDVPAINLLERFLDPYRQYRRHISHELEPFLELGGVALRRSQHIAPHPPRSRLVAWIDQPQAAPPPRTTVRGGRPRRGTRRRRPSPPATARSCDGVTDAHRQARRPRARNFRPAWASAWSSPATSISPTSAGTPSRTRRR